MILTLRREVYMLEATVGRLFIDDEFHSFTLEDTCRESFVRDGDVGMFTWNKEFKLYGRTAIPSGSYDVVLDFSNKYQRLMPHVLRVPDFTGIRIHNGGKVEHTAGCILPGKAWFPIDTTSAYLTGSKHYAFPRLYEKMQHADSIKINIINTVPVPFQ